LTQQLKDKKPDNINSKNGNKFKPGRISRAVAKKLLQTSVEGRIKGLALCYDTFMLRMLDNFANNIIHHERIVLHQFFCELTFKPSII
jgi:hypothetical protein